jgi:hypothetical protein
VEGKMEDLRFEFSKLTTITRVLFSLMEEQNPPYVLKIENAKHIVVPNVFKFYGRLGIPTPIPIKVENLIITADDFDNYLIIPTSEALVSVRSYKGQITSVKVYAETRTGLVGNFERDHMDTIKQYYQNINEFLPYTHDVVLGDYQQRKFTYCWLYTVSSALVSIFTLAYTLFNPGKVKISGSKDALTPNNNIAKQYFEYVSGIMRKLGDNFKEAVENLYIYDAFMH